ncbi:MAG TPA: DNA mismatch repair protein MutS, partial [Clostridiaceae bacterium]|nr:DNA mismatch repair protein MutS [Clostridiaceae bacterium]
IFLRKIVRGGADKSYGIQVAKLAGLPDEVIDKSKEILLKLEELDITKNLKEDDALKETAISSTKEKKNAQMSFFDFKGNEILESLKNIDVLNLTPMEALNLLYDISQKVQKL